METKSLLNLLDKDIHISPNSLEMKEGKKIGEAGRVLHKAGHSEIESVFSLSETKKPKRTETPPDHIHHSHVGVTTQ